VQLDEDAARHTEELRATVYRYTTLDAEFTFFELARFGQLTVKQVIKGTVRPLWFAGHAAGGPLGALLAPHPRGMVATFALDMAATDLAEDRDNDPIEDLMAAHLSGKAREDYEQARERYGYRVFKDRKFVASPELADDLRAFCAAAGTKNVIKTLSGG
jgi:hypothetical protein